MNAGLARVEDHPFFADWNGSDLSLLTNACEIRHYEDGDIIVDAGGTDYGCFFILSGEVTILSPINGHLVEIDRRTAGELFGEIALFTQEPFLARVVSSGNCEIAFLSQSVIREHFGSIPHALSRLLRSLVRHIGRASMGLAEKSHQHEKMAVVGSVVQDVVNDFQGSAQMINLGTEAINRLSRDRQVRLICTSITEQVRRILDLSTELAVFARNETQIQYSTVSLRDFMDEFRGENNAVFTNPALTISTDVTDARMELEPLGMKKALRNLLRNAAFSEGSEKKKLEIIAGPLDDDRVQISFHDSGYIPEVLQKNFWEPFIEPDTGICMSVVKGVVENHGGTVSFVSREGEGTTFVVILPRFHVTAE